MTSAKAADHLGTFSMEELEDEFEREKKPGGGCSSHFHVATRREQQLQKISKKFLDVRHMSTMEKPDYVLDLPYHAYVERFVEKLSFQYFFFAFVTLYSLVMGAELEWDDEKNDAMWFRVNCFFTFVFLC